MTMKKIGAVAAILAGALAFVPTAAGDVISLGIKFGFSLDRSKFDNLPFEATDNLKTIYGLRFAAQKEHLGLEVSYFYSSRSVEMKPDAPPGLQIDKLTWTVLSANLLYYPVWGTTLQPYVTGGYGSYRVNLAGYAKDRSGGFNAGVGLDLLILRHLSLSLEAKYHWVKFTLNDDRFDSSAWTSNFSLNFRF